MKKGISLVSLVLVIIVMIILLGVGVTTGSNYIAEATINKFALEILNIQTAVDEYYYRYDKYPTVNEAMLDVTNVDNASLSQFLFETQEDNKITFKTIDLSLIGISETEYGRLDNEQDVYVLSETTGKVYYLAGIKYDGKTYYTLTDDLYSVSGVTGITNVDQKDIKKYDVVFTVSSTEYTKNPIMVTVKLPKEATINSVTATNLKSVGEETVNGLYKQVQINQTSEDKTGNYVVEVNYTYNTVNKTVSYEVTNYDNTLPVVNKTETVNGNLTTIKVTATDDESGIKLLKYDDAIIENKAYFKTFGTDIKNNEFVIETGKLYTIYVENNAGNAVMLNNLPEGWSTSVIDIVDTVPIPRGFVASKALTEDSKAEGLVIYEGTKEVNDKNVETAKRTRNQYVWVPVDRDTFDATFIRQKHGLSYSIVTGSVGVTGYWEATPSIQATTENLDFVTSETLEEVQKMYESVKTYGGFYIARYEAGVDMTDRKTSNDGVIIKEVYSMMNKAPYNYVRWTYKDAMNEDTNGAVEVARSIYPESSTDYGVASTLVYGVQWDRTLAWWIETGAKDIDGNTIGVKDSATYGNHKNNEIIIETFNDGAQYSTGNGENYEQVTENKPEATRWLITTGATEETRVNNIYDMAGNLFEWTMEGNSDSKHIYRGGGAGYDSSKYPVSNRFSNTPGVADYDIGFRVSLYIK